MFTIRERALKNEAQPEVCDATVDAIGFRYRFVVVDIDGSGICDGGAWMLFGEEVSMVVVMVVVSKKKTAS